MTKGTGTMKTVVPVAAGVIAGVAATAVTVALAKKENREKIVKVAADMKKRGAVFTKMAAKRLDETKKITEKAEPVRKMVTGKLHHKGRTAAS